MFVLFRYSEELYNMDLIRRNIRQSYYVRSNKSYKGMNDLSCMIF